jgi:cyclopropane-fatty-acyl-phospholipid synthase
MLNRFAKRLFLRGLDHVHGGVLHLTCDRELHVGDPAGDLDATLVVANDRFFRRALAYGDIGIGEAYMDGDWTSPDLVPLIRLMLRNLAHVESSGGIVRLANRLAGLIARRLRDNTVDGSRDHIHRHYDLGNDFFRLFLDARHLMYSCGFYESPGDSLEAAQEQKLDRICRKLDLSPDDHVLEIGTGWGGFAIWAATQYGCRVTTTTISEEQHRHAREWVRRSGEAGSRVTVLREDYRTVQGRFDKIVSIEMFEAVGLAHYDDYFGAVDRLLAPDGVMLLQTITVDEQWFPRYRATPDWIEKYIFPGGELASVGAIVKSLARATRMSMHHAENIGTHYARTLHAWRERFHARIDEVRALGFDQRFVRMWDLYLAYCEAAFLERHAGDFQFVLAKNNTARTLFNEPWAQPAEDATAVA